LTASSVGVTVRATGSLAKDLTVQIYSQLFLSSLHYVDFFIFRTTQPGAVIRLDELSPYPDPRPSYNPDSETSILNLTAILRWEFFPGSTASLIYTRLQSPTVQLQNDDVASLDIRALRCGPAKHTLTFKLTYTWR
jgi:hypothetical protein